MNSASELRAAAEVDSSPADDRRAPGSLFRYSPGLMLVAIAIADGIRGSDPDLWGHLRFGQAMLTQHRLIHSDPYSYSVAGHLWSNHEWLSEVLMAAIFNHAGVPGLIMMKFVCTAVIAIFIAAALSETGASQLLQFGVLLYTMVVLRPQLQFRPQLFTFTMLAAVLWLLTREAYRRDARLWAAIPLLALWANFHGGFIMGIAALGIHAAVAGTQDVLAGRGRQRALKLSTITIVATLATLATPYGIATWETVAHALRNPYTRLVIMEWNPLGVTMRQQWQVNGFHLSNYEVGVALMAATAVCWLLTIEERDLPLAAVALVMAAAALVSTRNLPIAVLSTAAPLARHLSLALSQRWPGARERSPIRRWWWANQAALVMLSIGILFHTGAFESRLPPLAPFPAGACAFMQSHGLAGNVLNYFDWGEYLIWRLEPGSKVFIDGRYDTVYPFELIRQYVVFIFGLPGGTALLGAYPHDFVLIPPASAVARLMDSRADWKLIYRDSTARLYARRNSAAAQIPGVPVTGLDRSAMLP